MREDFETFRIKALSSLSPNVPLQDNLRAVMAASVQKLRNHTRAAVGIHIFTNPDVNELHALVIGDSDATRTALIEETKRRDRLQTDARPTPGLPHYVPVTHQITFPVVQTDREELQELKGPLLDLVVKLSKVKQCEDEFRDFQPQTGDMAIVIPIVRDQFQRLGYIVLCGPGRALKEPFDNPPEQEDRINFRQSIADTVIHLFSNFYHMAPATYLPSYYQVEEKYVTLFCAEIHGFEHLSEKLEASDRLGTLRNLLNKFCEIAARSVEENRGRVDQIWGNGMIAIFGEHLDTAEGDYGTTGVKRALTAGANFVEKFRAEAEKWVQQEFEAHPMFGIGVDEVAITPAVAIDHAKVFFDYVGSAERRVYMAIGDRVNFIKEVASLAGQVATTARGLDPIQAVLYRGFNPSNACWDAGFEGAPILLTKSARKLSRDYLEPLPNQTQQALHVSHLVSIPGRSRPFPVFGIWPENVAGIRRVVKKATP